jgi:two-component system chemotaxis response regulator CheB
LKNFPNIVVIGASDGGVEALTAIVNHLPSGFAAPVFAALTLDPRRLRRLPSILSRAGRLPVQFAMDNEPIREGRLYLVPEACQLILSPRTMFLSDAARRLGYQSTVDLLFASAAQAFAERVIGVILSGATGDGAAGLHTVKKEGGIAIVQQPDSTSFTRMPSTALASGPVDYVLPAPEIGPALALLVHDSQLLRRTA